MQHIATNDGNDTQIRFKSRLFAEFVAGIFIRLTVADRAVAGDLNLDSVDRC